jgi:hypothetical protein
LNSSKKTEEEGTFPNSFQESPIQKPEKDMPTKENYSLISAMNTEEKTLN